MSFHVRRVRRQDGTAETALGFRPSQVGVVKFSRTFSTQPEAEREAQAWRDSGDFDAEVVEGKAPNA